MEPSPPKELSPSKKNLENYAISYMGAYLNTVKKERPDHLPVLARNQFYDIDVCLLPNHCFAMLFEKSEKQNVKVKECGWDFVEGAVLSGVDHLVTVYAHEGVTVADAIARGKKDAVRDIRSVEDSDIARAIVQLEKILQGLTAVEQGNRGAVKLGQQELAKLQPVKDAIMSAGPNVDMLQMIDALKNYPGVPAGGTMGDKERALLEKIVSDLGDLSDVIRRAEAQDEKLEALEQSMKKVLTELNRTMDERVSKGLAAILQASDKKIDKGFTALTENAKKAAEAGFPKDLEVRLVELEKNLSAATLQLSSLQSQPHPEIEQMKEMDGRFGRLEKSIEGVQSLVEQGLREAAAQISALESRPNPEADSIKQLGGQLLKTEKELQSVRAGIEVRLDKTESELLSVRSKPDPVPEMARQLGGRLQAIEEGLEALQTAVEKRLAEEEADISSLEERPVTEPELVKSLADKLDVIEKEVVLIQAGVEQRLQEVAKSKPPEPAVKPQVVEELVLAVADLKENMARVNNRIIRVEEYLAQLSSLRVRKLKDKDQS